MSNPINLSTITDMVKHLAGNDELFFGSAVQVKLTPHSLPFNAWAVQISPKDELFVMDGSQNWHQLETTDINAELMIGSLYQRLSLMCAPKKEAPCIW